MDYADVIDGWLRICRAAARNLFRSGCIAAAVAFCLTNYALLMIASRFRELTYRMRETGLLDDMDLIADEALSKPVTGSEWFWMVLDQRGVRGASEDLF